MKAEPPDIEKIAIDRIRALREQRKWTQEKLAERAGLTPAAITRIERGVRVPTLGTLAKVAHGFGVSPGTR
jgi:transcriptional regulator with XRE-family HTH domain